MKKHLKFLFFTPEPGRKTVPLMRHGQWIDVREGEVIMAHESHRDMLERYKLRVVKNIPYFKTKKAAQEARNTLKLMPTE